MPVTYLYATCRQGSEPVLKKEVAARYAGLLTPAFMRPQLITWKVQGELPHGFRLESVYALTSGASLGMAQTVADIPALIAGADAKALQVIPREVPEDGIPAETWARVDAVAAEAHALLGLNSSTPATPGTLMLDIIVGAEGEPMLVGLRRQGVADFKPLSALLRMALPPEAPSRAWLKMEQALTWMGIESDLRGRVVLELGSSPGGSCYSLLSRGATVYGVDTGAMDPRVLAHPQFHHLRVAAGELRPSMLPDQIDLLVSDMNLEPLTVFRYVEKFIGRLRPRGLILTLKINSPQVQAELPIVIGRTQQIAPGPVHVRQLPANRQEVTLISWE